MLTNVFTFDPSPIARVVAKAVPRKTLDVQPMNVVRLLTLQSRVRAAFWGALNNERMGVEVGDVRFIYAEELSSHRDRNAG